MDMHHSSSEKNGTMVTKEKLSSDGGVNVGLIIGLVSLILLLAMFIIVIYYFTKSRKKGLKKNAADFIRNESTDSRIGVINKALEDEEAMSSSSTPTHSKKSLNSDDIRINIIPGEPTYMDRRHRPQEQKKRQKSFYDGPLDIFLNNIECSVITSKDSIKNHHEILEKVNSVRNNKDDKENNDRTLCDLLRTIEHTSLAGLTDLEEVCKCDGNKITKVVDDKNYSVPKTKHVDEGDMSFVRSISEIENGRTSNGIKDKSYFNIKGKHLEQY